jgi:hypothetical protein
MSAFRPQVIMASISSLLEGVTGIIRRVPPGTFKYGTFEGQPEIATKAQAGDVRYSHRFDIKFGSLRTHGSTFISTTGARRNSYIPITIDITTALPSTSQEDERLAERGRIYGNGCAALTALSCPHNLDTDANGTPTGIISGLLLGPDGTGHPEWESVSEDWTQQIHRSRISGAAILQIDQVTS